MRWIQAIFCLLFVSISWAGEYNLPSYSDLNTKDLGQMRQLVSKGLQKAYSSSEKAEDGDYMQPDNVWQGIQQVILVILARPDQDNMIAKLMPEIQSKIAEFGRLEDALKNVKAYALQKWNGATTDEKATLLFVLENTMSQARPYLKSNPDGKETKSWAKAIFLDIHKAQLEIPEKVKNNRKLRSMYKTSSPSATARLVLEQDLNMKFEK